MHKMFLVFLSVAVVVTSSESTPEPAAGVQPASSVNSLVRCA